MTKEYLRRFQNPDDEDQRQAMRVFEGWDESLEEATEAAEEEEVPDAYTALGEGVVEPDLDAYTALGEGVVEPDLEVCWPFKGVCGMLALGLCVSFVDTFKLQGTRVIMMVLSSCKLIPWSQQKGVEEEWL